MMSTITFTTDFAHSVFHSMAEGMYEVQCDDGHMARARRIEEIIEATPEQGLEYPVTFVLPLALHEDAEAILANVIDNDSEGAYRDREGSGAEDDPDGIYRIEEEIKLSMGLKDAARIALEMLDLAHGHWKDMDDTEYEPLKQAMQVLDEYLEEKESAHPAL
jgi:hypothetical protein